MHSTQTKNSPDAISGLFLVQTKISRYSPGGVSWNIGFEIINAFVIVSVSPAESVTRRVAVWVPSARNDTFGICGFVHPACVEGHCAGLPFVNVHTRFEIVDPGVGSDKSFRYIELPATNFIFAQSPKITLSFEHSIFVRSVCTLSPGAASGLVRLGIPRGPLQVSE